MMMKVLALFVASASGLVLRQAITMGGHAVIVQNKGGGHGEIGFHLSNALVGKDMRVTLMQDGAAKKTALPFSKYGELPEGVNVVWCDDVTDAGAVKSVLDGAEVSHIFDNYAKKPEHAHAYMDVAKEQGAFYTYVSSAGMYTKNGILKETMPVKQTGQRDVECALEASLAKRWCAFRPQYIYGPYTNKRTYLDWFLDRAARGLPMAVPGDAQQPVSITHCEDVAALIASVVGKEAEAGGEVFNCGTSRMCSYDDVCLAAAAALGKEAPTVASLPPNTKSSFPFRPSAEGFAVRTRKAQDVLGWKGATHDCLEDLKSWYKDDFLSLGLDKGDIDTTEDKLELCQNL